MLSYVIYSTATETHFPVQGQVIWWHQAVRIHELLGIVVNVGKSKHILLSVNGLFYTIHHFIPFVVIYAWICVIFFFWLANVDHTHDHSLPTQFQHSEIIQFAILSMGVSGPSKRGTVPYKAIFCDIPLGLTYTWYPLISFDILWSVAL